MGLDQYAYVAAKENSDYGSRREIAYWRKHPNLQGWMEQLWLEKNSVPRSESDQFIEGKFKSIDFNGVELELTWDDIERLELDIVNGQVEKLNTVGFFFGNASDSRYREKDLEFIRAAKAELFLGLKVFYNSSW